MSMADRDGFIWMDGKLVDWRDANIHVLTHSLHYGMAVFEGVRAYKTDNGTSIFRLPEHTRRFHEWRQIHECMPYIEDVCSFAERELAHELGCADAEEYSRVKAATRSMMNKLLFSLKERVDIDMAKECYCALAKAAQR